MTSENPEPRIPTAQLIYSKLIKFENDLGKRNPIDEFNSWMHVFKQIKMKQNNQNPFAQRTNFNSWNGKWFDTQYQRDTQIGMEYYPNTAIDVDQFGYQEDSIDSRGEVISIWYRHRVEDLPKFRQFTLTLTRSYSIGKPVIAVNRTDITDPAN